MGIDYGRRSSGFVAGYLSYIHVIVVQTPETGINKRAESKLTKESSERWRRPKLLGR